MQTWPLQTKIDSHQADYRLTALDLDGMIQLGGTMHPADAADVHTVLASGEIEEAERRVARPAAG